MTFIGPKTGGRAQRSASFFIGLKTGDVLELTIYRRFFVVPMATEVH
jgi:hypothetical protein